MDKQDVTTLWMLLQIHEALLKYPHYRRLRRQVEAQLDSLNDDDLGPTEPIDSSDQRPAPVYPEGVGQAEALEGKSETVRRV